MSLSLGRAAFSRSSRTFAACALLAAGLGAFACVRVSRWLADPAVPLLLPDALLSHAVRSDALRSNSLLSAAAARWIVTEEPFRLSLRKLQHYKAIFRKRIDVAEKLASARLELRAFKIAAVFVDGRLAAPPRQDFAEWKSPVEIELAGLLAPGSHELEVQVVNENGPAALLARCEALGVASDPTWSASVDGEEWKPARPASETRRPEIASQFPTSRDALSASAPFLGAVFALVAILSAWRQRSTSRPRWLESFPPAPIFAKWALTFAWCLLAANNIQRVPAYVGFDSLQHLDYIRYVAERGTIPLASEGWQMFQSPLYYLVSAPLYSLLSRFYEAETVAQLLRVVPFACGAGQVHLSFLAARRVFRDRPDLQVLSTLVGGLLPMNLYLAQGVGNEPLAGFLSGAVIVVALGLIVDGPERGLARTAALLGALLGLALLTKVTAALLLPPVAAVVAAAAWRRDAGGSRPLRAAGAVLLVLGIAGLTCGWYYARNWIALGKPFLGGWDPGRAIVWWQDPGYRTLESFTRFGDALVQPVYAATAGFWDALYSTFWADGYLSMVISYAWRPPWHYDLMIAGALLALVPTVAMAIGAISPVARAYRSRWKPILFAVASIGIFLAALLALFASLPIYSTGKATYLAGLTAAFALLAAAGLEVLTRLRALRPIVHGAVAAWAAAAYFAYFVF
jgi:hypothetical protein